MTKNKLKLDLIIGAKGKEEREALDFYATHPHTVTAFLNALKRDNIELSNHILEPCCGQGHISETLKKCGFDVESADIIDRGYKDTIIKDFLLPCSVNSVDKDIITNPPFNKAVEFVKQGLNLITKGHKLCLFLKIQFLEGVKRSFLFQEKSPKYVYVCSARQHVAKNGDFEKYTCKPLMFAWYIWEKGYNGDTVLRWIY